MADKEKKPIPGYPRCKYRRAGQNEGDLCQQYSQERYPYVSAIVSDPEEEKRLGSRWFDHPSQIDDRLEQDEPPPLAPVVEKKSAAKEK